MKILELWSNKKSNSFMDAMKYNKWKEYYGQYSKDQAKRRYAALVNILNKK